MALLRGDTVFARPHSQVLAFGNWTPTSTDGGLWAWNPTSDAAASAGSNLTSLYVPPPPYNLFCAGAATIPNLSGDLLVLSGTERGKTGAKFSARFNAHAQNPLNRWTTSPMSSGRWYGNITPMASGGKMLATAGNKYHHVVVFGGLREDAALVSDVQRYAITTDGAWETALTGSGADWPAPRESPSLTDEQEGPYTLFGGKDGSGATRNDVWQLRLHDNRFAESYRWARIDPANALDIPSRWRHAAVSVPVSAATVYPAIADTLSTMYVHGGERISGTATTLPDMWKLEWVPTPTPGHWEWFEVAPTGPTPADIPAARFGHSMIWDEKNSRAIMYGGRTSAGITDPDVYVLTFPSGVPTWKKAKPPTPTAVVPAARTRHAMAVNRKPEISTGVVFGGETASGLSNQLWEFTVTTDTALVVTWVQHTPTAGSTLPPARADASIIVYTEHPTSYVIFGGETTEGTGWDRRPWEFRFDTQVWKPQAELAQALRGHRAIPEQRLLTELQPEVYDPDAAPGTNPWSAFGQTLKRQSYHMMFLASDGKFYSPGPNNATTDSTWRFNPNPPPDPESGQWSLYTANTSTLIPPLDGTIGGILYRPNLMMKCGGTTSFEVGGVTKSIQIGLSTTPAPGPAWRLSANPMGETRADHYLNMLPTGQVLATGGWGQGGDRDEDETDEMPRKRPLIWDPTYVSGSTVGYWYGAGATGDLLLAEEPVTRGHHSSSVLLPDGRLLSGGGWEYHLPSRHRSIDQYSPPYLFTPAGGVAVRPRLYGAQEHITWNQDFRVACPDPVVEACLIRPGATTHAFNQDNRYIPLTKVSQSGHQVLLRIDGDRNFAPPGNYLLFVLRNDAGTKVPSIARWVNVGEVATIHDTWDLVPPAAINDLVVTGYTSTSHTLQWTAPANDVGGTTGRVTRYEIRYRSDGQMPTLEDFHTYGTSVAAPVPLIAGQVHTFTVNHPPAGQTLYFRIISRDAAGHDRNWSALSNEAQTPSGGSAGCPFVDTRTASGWEVENSILGRSLSGAMALDGYRLRYAPEVRDGRVRLRVRENEQERTTLDQLRLIAVDHLPGVRAYPVGDRVVLGSRVAASRVTTTAGVDVTALVNGSGEGFHGAPGDTLLIEFSSEAAMKIGVDATTSHDPFLEGDGGKCPPDCGSPLRSPDRMSASGVDAQVLSQSGVRIQARDALGAWQTVVTRYPREYLDEAVMEEVGHGALRLVFVGRHAVHFLGRLEPGGGEFTASKLPLLSAGHTRFGDVMAAVDSIGNLTSELTPGDTVSLEFGWTPVPEGQVRELFLLSHGVYTANLPAALEEAPPARFAVQSWKPNPFAASATLHFGLPEGRLVRLDVLDAQGRRVRILANHWLPAGAHAIEWDGRNESGGRVGAGVYFYRFEAGEWRANGRVTLVP